MVAGDKNKIKFNPNFYYKSKVLDALNNWDKWATMFWVQ